MRAKRESGRGGLAVQVEELKARLREAEEALRAIREGEVDAIVVSGSHGEQVFSLAASDLAYRLIVQAMSEAALTTTLDGTILFCNPQFARLVGVPMEDLVGGRLTDLAPLENGGGLDTLLHDAASGVVKRRVVLRGASGPVPALVSAAPLEQPDGPALCVVAMDLTELESSAATIQELSRQRELLKRATERFGLLSETAARLLSSRDPLVTVDELCLRVMEILDCQWFANYVVTEDGGALRLNTWRGASTEQVAPWRTLEMGQSSSGSVAASGQPLVLESVQSAGDPRVEISRVIPIDAFACLPLVSPGRVIGTLALGTVKRPAFSADDVALMMSVANQVAIALERSHSEEALKRVNEDLEVRVEQRTAELRQANRELERRAHQLRNLAGELSLAEQRERRRLAGMLHDHLQQLLVGARFHVPLLKRRSGAELEEAVERLDELLGQSIELSRTLTAELSPPVLHAQGLGPALQWLAQWMGSKQHLAVALDIPPSLPATSEDVTAQLFQSVRELLFNVVKHAGVGAARLEVAERGGTLRFTVSDDGAGFDPSVLHEKAGTESFGLFSIRERLELIGGHLEVATSLGKGSRFTLVVPCTQLNATGQEGERRPLAAASPGGEGGAAARTRVLLVDDHEITRKGLVELLAKEADLEVVGDAADGMAAIGLVDELDPAVVVMDVSMPGMTGMEATRAILARHPRVRIVALSMYEDESVASAMRQAGAVMYLSKAGAPQHLVQAVRSCGRPPAP